MQEAGEDAGAPDGERAAARMTVRLAVDTAGDFRAGLALAEAMHRRTVFRDIPFSEKKARALFDRALADPARFGLIYATSREKTGGVGGPGSLRLCVGSGR